MAHFAKINKQNKVEQIVVVNNNDCNGGDFPHSESAGNDFLNSIGLDGVWKQTSYNGSFRRRYASEGCIYDPVNDVFILPKPYPSWTLDSNFDWQPPMPKPADTESTKYYWKEAEQQWIPTNIKEL